MGAKTYVIKCMKCKKIYVGTDLDRLILDNKLTPKGKGYICDCPGQFFPKESKKEKKGHGFFPE